MKITTVVMSVATATGTTPRSFAPAKDLLQGRGVSAPGGARRLRGTGYTIAIEPDSVTGDLLV